MKIISPNNAQSGQLSKALQPYSAKAFRPLFARLGIIPQKEACEYNLIFACELSIKMPARKIEFTDHEIRVAAQNGKFLSGMTADDLAAVVSNSIGYKNETCLDAAARNGKLPKGTTLKDLLNTRGGTRRRTLFALLESQNIHYPADVTAQDLKKIKQHRWGTFLHKAAKTGVYPKGTAILDLMTGQNKEGKTPLHVAAEFGGLLTCSKADLSQVPDAKGMTPWDYAVETLAPPDDEKEYWHYYYKKPVNNILACPALASKLRPQKIEFHQAIVTELLASPKLTPELRGKLAQYPQICAAML